MTEKVKKRIEDINNGIVPEGYKRVGKDIIPDDWEQRKVSDICTNMSAGGDVDKSKLVDNGKYPVIANALTNEGIVGYYNDEYRIKAPAVTVTGRGDVGHAKARKVDFTPVVRLLTLETEHDVDFLENAINTVSIVNESTGVPQLTVPQLSQYTLSVPPTLEEEKAIGEYLLSFDTLITLHQRKCDELKNLKKAYLTKMFPQKGQKRPEIRFSGFTDDWEQRKLGEIVDYSNGTGHEEYVLPEGKYELITLKSINSEGELVSSGKYVNEEFKTLSQGTIIMMLSEQAKGMLGMTTIIPCNNRYILNQRVAALNLHSGICDTFLTKAINNKQSYFEQMGAGTKVQNISKGHVENCIIKLPNYDEQVKIGTFFTNLDTTITLHQRKCELLKMKKKALMQLVMTGKVRFKV